MPDVPTLTTFHVWPALWLIATPFPTAEYTRDGSSGAKTISLIVACQYELPRHSAIRASIKTVPAGDETAVRPCRQNDVHVRRRNSQVQDRRCVERARRVGLARVRLRPGHLTEGMPGIIRAPDSGKSARVHADSVRAQCQRENAAARRVVYVAAAKGRREGPTSAIVIDGIALQRQGMSTVISVRSCESLSWKACTIRLRNAASRTRASLWLCSTRCSGTSSSRLFQT